MTTKQEMLAMANKLRYSGTDSFSEEAADMLDECASLGEGVSEEVVETACKTSYEFGRASKWDKLRDCWKEKYRQAMRAALEAVLPHLRGVSVPEGWKITSSFDPTGSPPQPKESHGHREHGREICPDGGPSDTDCPCRAGPKQAKCAAAGCGYCQAAESMSQITLAVGVDANWIARHQIAAGDCPQQSEVILVSSLKRMLPAAVDVEAAQDD